MLLTGNFWKLKTKRKYYQCNICEAYKTYEITWRKDEAPDVCTNCYSEFSRINNCKRHLGVAEDSKTCGLCIIEAQMSAIIPEMNRLFNKA